VPHHPRRYRRSSLRLRGYDYSSQGAYFVTICTYQRTCLFGKIVNGKTQLSPFGQIADDYWQQIPTHFPNVDLDEYIIMPNHVHGIIFTKYSVIKKQSGTTERFGNMMKPGALSTIVRSFKSATTRQINILRAAPGSPVWQRNYYDHIIRNAMSYGQIKQYIRHNPLLWQTDQLHPNNPSKW